MDDEIKAGRKTGRLRRVVRLLVALCVACGIAAVATLWILYGVGRSPDERIEIVEYGDPISAALYLPVGEPRGAIVLCHGSRRSGGSHPVYRALARDLAERYVVLAIDMSGFGESPPRSGEFLRDIGFSDNVEAGARYLAKRLGMEARDVVLIGHSLGSWQVINAGSQLRSRRVFSIGPGNVQDLLDGPVGKEYYIEKIRRHTGMRIDPDRFAELLAPVQIDTLSRACAIVKLVFGYAGRESAWQKMMREHVRRNVELPKLPYEVSFETIPGTNHVYGTEPNWLLRRVRVPLRLCPSQAKVRELADCILAQCET